MANNILSYTSRDFNSIKQDLINAIPSLTDIWTNREESDPGMVLLTLMSALGDNLSYNMDKQSLEFFGQSVTQRKNASRLFDLIGYKMHWYKSAELEIEIYNNNDTAVTLLFNPTSHNTQRLVSNLIPNAPAYFILAADETPANWNTNRIVTIPSKQSAKFNAVQGELQSINFSSTAIDANNRYYLPVSKIDQNHIWLKDDKNYQWYLVDSINELTETLPRFEFGVDEYSLPYIEFVPHWRTSFDETHNFTLYYLNTRGSMGSVSSNVLTTIPTLKRINNGSSEFNANIIIVHDSNTGHSPNLLNIAGKDPQSAQSAYTDSRNYIGTYNTLVTLIDFENFMKRLTNTPMSLVKAIDGQRADEINEKLLDSLRTKYRNVDNGDEIALDLYDKNLITFENASVITDAENNLTIKHAAVEERNINLDSNEDGIKDYDEDEDGDVLDDLEHDHFGFAPYTVQMHMVYDNFATKYGNSDIAINEIVKYDEDTEGVTPNGYINYMLTDRVIGSSDDSTISQSNLNQYKLYSAKLSYAPVRKFPFFINGKIHLKEPMRPVDANLVLYHAFLALNRRFSATNLELGEKINFKDIIDTINEADENIHYFDAGANSTTGSLIEYPKSTDFNKDKYIINENNYEPMGIDINIDLFNDVSLQSYADVLQNNNVLMYFCNTFSNKLTIAEDSILEKDNPPVHNTILKIESTQSHWVLDEHNNKLYYEPKLEVWTNPTNSKNATKVIDNSEVFRYNLVANIHCDVTENSTIYEPNDYNNPIRYCINDGNGFIKLDENNKPETTTEKDLSTWFRQPPKIPFVSGNLIETEFHASGGGTLPTGFMFAYATIETITTKESAVILSNTINPYTPDDK